MTAVTELTQGMQPGSALAVGSVGEKEMPRGTRKQWTHSPRSLALMDSARRLSGAGVGDRRLLGPKLRDRIASAWGPPGRHAILEQSARSHQGGVHSRPDRRGGDAL